jgi:hypothetical protein
MKRSAYRSRDSYAQVNWEMVKEVGGDITMAVVFDWITWKADAAYDGVLDDDGNVWYAASLTTLAETMNVTEKVIRRALNALVESGHLDTALLRTGGAYDRTKAYRPVWDDEKTAAATPEIDPDDSDESAEVEGKCICPTGQMDEPLQGRCHLPSGADVPLYETSTEVKDKDSLSAGELVVFEAPTPTLTEYFEAFWSAYPRHAGKAPAERKFAAAAKKIPPADLVAHAEAYRDDPNRSQDLQYVPHPATWLHQERWTDVLVASTSPQAKPTALDHNLALVERFRQMGEPDESRTDRDPLGLGR